MERTKDITYLKLLKIIANFDFNGKFEKVNLFGNGHINETYYVVFSSEAGKKQIYSAEDKQTDFREPEG